jgi:hypothetical protein
MIFILILMVYISQLKVSKEVLETEESTLIGILDYIK